MGDYEILYTYRTANGCSKTTLTGNNFRINPLPVLSFTLSNDNMCNYVPDQTVTLTPTWVNQGANTFVSGNGKINIYNAANSQISVPNGQNIISKNFITIAHGIRNIFFHI